MGNAGDLIATLRMDAAQFTRGAQQASRAVDGITESTRRSQSRIGQWAGAMRLAAAAGAAIFAKQAIGAAVAAEEAAAAFGTTFGPATQQASRFVEEFANKAGFANYQLEQMMAVTGNVVQGLGATEQASLDLTRRMVVLAGDVASFSNASGGAQAVMLALQSAINGEREALKTYGLAVSEAEVQQKAFEMTGKSSVAELTRMDKALATVEVAYGKAAKAIGDLDRTADSHANTLRRVSAMFEELKVTVGEELLPALDASLPAVENLIKAFGALVSIPVAGSSVLGMIAGGLIAGPAGAATGAVLGLGLAMADVGAGKMREAAAAYDVFGLALRSGSEGRVEAINQLRILGGVGNELADALARMGPEAYAARDALASMISGISASMGPLFAGDTAMAGRLSSAANMRAAFATMPVVSGQAVDRWAETVAGNMRRASQKALVDPIQQAFEESRREVLKGFAAISRGFAEFKLPEISVDEFMANMADWREAQDNVDAMLSMLGDSGLRSFATALAQGLTSEQLAWIANEWGGDLRSLYALMPAYGPTGGLHPGAGNLPFTPRAAGGPVNAMSPYLVGERGPELFVPSGSGTIVPGGRSGGTSVNIGMVIGDDLAVAKAVDTALRRAKQRGM